VSRFSSVMSNRYKGRLVACERMISRTNLKNFLEIELDGDDALKLYSFVS